MKCVISVLGGDRTGIVAAVANVLTESNANIDDINQTVLGKNELFCMTMLATLDTNSSSFEQVQEKLAKAGQDLGIQITMQREDVFRFMHEI